MIKTNKQIIVDSETRKFILATFKCSTVQVWMALNFKRDTDQIRRIQKLALMRGGILIGGTEDALNEEKAFGNS